MKKLFAVCLVLVMALSMNLTAFAAGFVASPTNNPAPEVENGDVIVTPYPDRDDLGDDDQKDLEDAYQDILNSNDLTDLIDGLDDLADELDIPTGQIAASDLFDVTGPNGTEVTLSSDTLEHFVGLAVRVDGKWTLVDDAKIENGRLVFTVDASGPYAVLVNAGNYTNPPKTGEDNSIALYACGMAVSALAMVVLWKKSKAK